jgi:hypothetical protein
VAAPILKNEKNIIIPHVSNNVKRKKIKHRHCDGYKIAKHLDQISFTIVFSYLMPVWLKSLQSNLKYQERYQKIQNFILFSSNQLDEVKVEKFHLSFKSLLRTFFDSFYNFFSRNLKSARNSVCFETHRKM